VDLFSATQYLLFLAIVTALVKPLGGYIELLAILLLPAALTNTFGRMVRQPRQG
jgi:K+-transporting ATPase A subunit